MQFLIYFPSDRFIASRYAYSWFNSNEPYIFAPIYYFSFLTFGSLFFLTTELSLHLKYGIDLNYICPSFDIKILILEIYLIERVKDEYRN